MTPSEISALKGKQKITVLTAYTHDVARIVSKHVDVVLVGDSLGMVLYGLPSTTHVTLEMMIQHGKAVVSAAENALVVVDMPYGSVEKNKDDALKNCKRVMSETGCGAVKIEGGAELADTIAYLTNNGISVMAHIGMMPQRAAQYGGFKVQSETDVILADAKAIETAGAFSVVVEAVKEPIAREMTALLKIPTIGIGASPACDGQVLVSEDMSGLTGNKFKFLRQFGNLEAALDNAAKAYVEAVKTGTFPSAENCY